MSEQDDKAYLLSEHVRGEIDHWMTKFPYEGRQSACLQALMAVLGQYGADGRGGRLHGCAARVDL